MLKYLENKLKIIDSDSAEATLALINSQLKFEPKLNNLQ